MKHRTLKAIIDDMVTHGVKAKISRLEWARMHNRHRFYDEVVLGHLAREYVRTEAYYEEKNKKRRQK